MKHLKLPFKIALFLLCITAFQACKKKDNTAPKPYVDPNYVPLAVDPVWNSKLYDARLCTLNTNNDLLVFSEYNFNPQFKLLDGVTGEEKWSWYDFAPGINSFPINYLFYNDYLIISQGDYSYCVNMITGITIWSHKFETLKGTSRIFKDEDYVYQELKDNNDKYKTHIYRTKCNQLNWQLVCTYQNSTANIYELSVFEMNFCKNKLGQRLIVFSISETYLLGNRNVNMVAFNLESNNFEWSRKFQGKSNYNIYDAKGDKLFAVFDNGSQRNIIAINSNDGSVLWDNLYDQFVNSFYLYNDKLVVSLENNGILNGSLLCLNPLTGSKYWQDDFNTNSGGLLDSIEFDSGNEQTCYKNYLFSPQCTKMLIVDLEDGSVFFNKQVAYPKTCLTWGFLINEQNGLFYSNDGYYVNCFKLPKGLIFK